jgi:hypothetical protein
MTASAFIAGGGGLRVPPVILDAALGPHEALDRARQHEEMGLTIRGVVFDHLLGRNPGPCIIEPSIPDVVWLYPKAQIHEWLSKKCWLLSKKLQVKHPSALNTTR